MSERTPTKKVSHFSTRLVERTGTLLVEKNVATRCSKGGRFIENMTLIDKSNIEIEQAFRLASEKVSRA
jgi:hypothetical protein